MKNYQINIYQYVALLFFFIRLKVHAQRYESDNDNPKTNCWLGLNSSKLFDDLDKLDKSYEKIRDNYEKSVGLKNFDEEMLAAMLNSEGVAKRLPYRKHEFPGGTIPAGLNLGGHCLVSLNQTLLLFYRMKLRNETRFRVNYVQSSLKEMTLSAHLSLHDLHLLGSYQRILADRDPSIWFYRPTFGRVELLLKDVKYKLEGRYRLLHDRLYIEHIISDIIVPEIIMTYSRNATFLESKAIPTGLMDEFLQRMKTDLDKWLQDYFNDYLVQLGLGREQDNYKFLQYDIKKAKVLNMFVDNAINRLKNRMYETKALALSASNFTLFMVNGMQIRLTSGVIRGFDSMHRKSVATTRKQDKVRHVNAVVGFGTLKVEYHYQALAGTDVPPLEGLFILTSDELIARMDLELIKEPDTANLYLRYMENLKPVTLTAEGSITRFLPNFKHVMENHIIALMSNMLYHRLLLFASITKCMPDLPIHVDLGEFSEEEIPIPIEEEVEYVEEEEEEEKDEKKDGKKDEKKDGKKDEKLSEKIEDSDKKKEIEERKVDVEYGVKKEHSIELELPAKGKQPVKTIKINYVQNLTMDEIKDQENRYKMKQESDETEAEIKPPEKDVDSTTDSDFHPNKSTKSQIFEDPDNNFGIERQDSAEIEISGEGNKPTQKKNIIYKQQFSIKDVTESHEKLANEPKAEPEVESEAEPEDKQEAEPDTAPETVPNAENNVESEPEMKYDFGVQRQDSANVKFIPEGEQSLKDMRIKYQEDFSLKEV